MSLQDGTSSKESFKPSNPPTGAKTHRPTENGRIGGKSTKGTKK